MSFGRVEYYKPKRKKPTRKAQFTGMGSLMSGALHRHGIERQVTSALVVEKAKELMPMLFADYVIPDIRVLSYVKEELHIACRCSEAMDAVMSKRMEIMDALVLAFPALALRDVKPLYRPQLFTDEHGIIFS
ncbi:MAG: hypothetical protein WCT24_00870 [Patescibacteria group bacterium]